MIVVFILCRRFSGDSGFHLLYLILKPNNLRCILSHSGGHGWVFKSDCCTDLRFGVGLFLLNGLPPHTDVQGFAHVVAVGCHAHSDLLRVIFWEAVDEAEEVLVIYSRGASFHFCLIFVNIPLYFRCV